MHSLDSQMLDDLDIDIDIDIDLDDALSGGRERNLSETERWASMIGGGALVAYGLSRRSWSGLALALFGGALGLRGKTGRCPVYRTLGITSRAPCGTELALSDSIAIDRPPEEVYRFFRTFENLPRFMKHVATVTPIGEGRSHWVLTLPGKTTIEWDAQIVEDRKNQLIRWRSLEGADIGHHGEVRFEKTPSGQGSVVQVVLKYHPPGATVGALFAKLAEVLSRSTLKEELGRLKEIMEAPLSLELNGDVGFDELAELRDDFDELPRGPAPPPRHTLH